MSELFVGEGGERYDGDAGLRMGRKPGHLCDVQAEVQVSVTACIWSLSGPVFSGKPTGPGCAQASGSTPSTWHSMGPMQLWDNESRIYSS